MNQNFQLTLDEETTGLSALEPRIIRFNTGSKPGKDLTEMTSLDLDSDGDGLTNIQEIALGTDISHFDTDGDLLSDEYEVTHGLDPNNSQGDDGKDGDKDDDNVSNFDESIFGTNPGVRDTDGDGSSDGAEISQGSNPNNGSDGGIAPPQADIFDVEFTVGDPSGSHSERWQMIIVESFDNTSSANPASSGAPKTYKFTGPDYGKVGKKSFKLNRHASYNVRLKHLGTDPELELDQPDYDWEATIGGEPKVKGTEEDAKAFIVEASNSYGSAVWVIENEAGLLTTERHGDTENLTTGKKSDLLPVEVIISKLDANGGQIDGEFVGASELKVAKWEDAFEGTFNDGSVKDDFIGWDKDRFYIRIPGGDSLGVEAVKVATEDCPDPSYNDDSTTVLLMASGGDAISDSIILVSDDHDDDYAGSGAGADDQEGDRTHKVQLGGNFVIKSIIINGEDHDLDVKIPVPVRKVLPMDFIRMNVAGVRPLAEIQQAVKIVNERYAQVGLCVDVTIKELAWPNIPDRQPGYLDLFDEPPGGLRGPLSNEYKSFIDQTDSAGTNLFFLLAAYSSNGIAITPSQILFESGEVDGKYFDKAFVHFSSNSPGYTSAHELAHLLAYRTDGENDHSEPFWNLLNVTNVNQDPPVLWSKRISSVQQERIDQHPQVNDP